MGTDGSDPRREWAFLGRRVLVVGRFPPVEDGVARYADQLIDALGGDRAFVRLGDGGDIWGKLAGGLRPLRIARFSWNRDDVLVMYLPSYFLRGGLLSRMASYWALLVVSRVRRTTFVIHERDDERDDERLTQPGRRTGLAFRLEEAIRRRLWARRVNLVFHTEWERDRFAERFPSRGRTERIVTHGAHFTTGVTAGKSEARARLGLPSEDALLLCIGFISPHKDYERVIRAMESAPDRVLHIVGARINEYPAVVAYLDRLRGLVARTPNVHLHEGFVEDEEFDLWIRAADAVVIPYRVASSSGIVARAHLLGARVLSSGAGGIAGQLGPADTVFASDAELVEAIRAVGVVTRAT
jgi:glycosyltransferase involved in cell wall biosynthesis